jgi:hypothetical protein
MGGLLIKNAAKKPVEPIKAPDPVQEEPPRNEEGLRLDGPTVAEWVAAGYQEEHYPPKGYAPKPVKAE